MCSLDSLFFPTKVCLFRRGRAAAISDTDNHVALPPFSSDPSVPISVSHYVSLFWTLLDTQAEGCSRRCHMMACGPIVVAQNSDTSIPALIRTPALVTCTHTACLYSQKSGHSAGMCSCLLYMSLVRESKLKQIKIS